jgi:hypothetical protein
VSVVLIVLLPSRVNSRCQLSLLSFEGVSEMFLLQSLFGLLIFYAFRVMCVYLRDADSSSIFFRVFVFS